jgi:hypothetical protein
MARFVNAQVPEVLQPFWAALQAGEFIADAGCTWKSKGGCATAAPPHTRTRAGRTRARWVSRRCAASMSRHEPSIDARVGCSSSAVR